IYTLNAYKPNKQSKAAHRKLRRETIESAKEILEVVPGFIETLESKVRNLQAGEAVKLHPVFTKLRLFKKQLQSAQRVLERYRRVPRDAPETCRCGLLSRRSV
ncbi:MAG: hypothetical protein ACPG4T_22985, partial [Nannocystaceae bacterium]